MNKCLNNTCSSKKVWLRLLIPVIAVACVVAFFAIRSAIISERIQPTMRDDVKYIALDVIQATENFVEGRTDYDTFCDELNQLSGKASDLAFTDDETVDEANATQVIAHIGLISSVSIKYRVGEGTKSEILEVANELRDYVSSRS